MYSRATFSIMFEQLDLNENGKIDPHEIDESLEDQIKPRAIKGNLNHNKMKLIVLSSLKSSIFTFLEFLHIYNFRGKENHEEKDLSSDQGMKKHIVPIVVHSESKHFE